MRLPPSLSIHGFSTWLNLQNNFWVLNHGTGIHSVLFSAFCKLLCKVFGACVAFAFFCLEVVGNFTLGFGILFTVTMMSKFVNIFINEINNNPAQYI